MSLITANATIDPNEKTFQTTETVLNKEILNRN